MKRSLPALFILSSVTSLFPSVSEAQTPPPPKIALESTEWLDYRVYHADKNDLPRVLLIGDSISGQYFDGVVKDLQGKAYVTRLGSSKAIGLPVYFDEVKLALSQYNYAVIHLIMACMAGIIRRTNMGRVWPSWCSC